MELIAKIYEALDDDDALAALPKTLAEAVGGRSATLMWHSSQLALEEIYTHYFSREMAAFYETHHIDRFDEWSKIMDRETAGRGKTIRVGDFQTRNEYERSFFYQEFIRNFGDDSTYCIGFASNRSDGGMVTLGVHKGRTATDFSDEQLNLLESLRPHITRMVTLRRNLIKLSNRAFGAVVGMNQIEDAYLVISPKRDILFANSAAEALLRKKRLIKTRAGRLQLESRTEDAQLTRTMKDIVAKKADGRTAFVAKDRCGETWRFTLAPKVIEERTLILVWIDRGKASETASERMQQLYGFTSAELPVLEALSQGHTAQEIASLQNVSVATVRTHIQHIYDKSGVHKASELAALVASLPKVS